MLGIILCGGQSLRMGTDKGLLIYQGKTWAALAIEKLDRLDIPMKLAVNPAQEAVYTKHFTTQKLIVDHPSIDTKGPLLGVLSAHMAAPEEDLLLLACDLLLMEHHLLQTLIEAYEMAGNYDAYVFTYAKQREPLCGIYTSKGLKEIMFLLQDKGIPKPSMQFILQNLRVLSLELKTADLPYFSNFNSPSVLDQLH